MAEQEAFSAGSDKMGVVVLRPALVYGPGVKGNFATLLEALRRGRRPPLPLVENRRSLIGLEDLTRCCLLAAERYTATGRTYVVTDGQVYSTEQVIRALAEAISVNPTPRVRVPLPVMQAAARVGDGVRYLTGRRLPFDSEMLRRLLGNAEYESRRAEDELRFQPVQRLEQAGRW